MRLPRLSGSDITNQVIAGVLVLAIGGLIAWLATTAGSAPPGPGSPSSPARATDVANASPRAPTSSPPSSPTIADDPAAVAHALVEAWQRRDRAAAERLSTDAAVDALFARAPLEVATFDACREVATDTWDCNYSDPGGPIVVIRVTRGASGLIVTEVGFIES